MQNQGHVIGLKGLFQTWFLIAVITGEKGLPGVVRGDGDCDDRVRKVYLDRFAFRWGGDDRLGVGIVQAETELFFRVGRVQGCGGRSGRGNRQEGNDVFDAVGQDDRYPVPSADAEGMQLVSQGIHLTPEVSIGEHRPIGGNDGDVGGLSPFQNVFDRAGLDHAGRRGRLEFLNISVHSLGSFLPSGDWTFT